MSPPSVLMDLLSLVASAGLGAGFALLVRVVLDRRQEEREFRKEGARELLRAVIEAGRTVGTRGQGPQTFDFERAREALEKFDDAWTLWQDRLLDDPKAMVDIEAVGALLEVAPAAEGESRIAFESLFAAAAQAAEEGLTAILRSAKAPQPQMLDGHTMKLLILDDPTLGKLSARFKQEGLSPPFALST